MVADAASGAGVIGTLFGRPLIVSADLTADSLVCGDLSGIALYDRQPMVAEATRDEEFSLDNTLFKFGARWDAGIAEASRIKRFIGA